MELALAPKKICPDERSPEIRADTEWSALLAAASAVPTVMRDLDTPAARSRYTPDSLLILLDGLLDDDECLRLNTAAEAIGYGRTSYPQAYRGNLRLIVTDVGLASALWERVRPHVPETLCGGVGTWRAVGLNEVFRLAKYYEGHRFGAHCDAHFEREEHERSFFTVNIYTNTVATEHGGRTRFYAEHCDRRTKQHRDGEGGDERFDLQVQPVAGRAALFRHGPKMELLHDGERLHCGVKYLLRTDVMYRRVQ